jgi:N-acetyl-gamma-glutamyl-phosphate reductase
MSQNKVRIAIAGATGYVGLDLIYYLCKHSKAHISYLCAQKNLNSNIQKFDKRIKKKLPKISKLSKVNWNNVDLLFLSLPNGEAQKIVKDLYKFKHLKFIDLSADFRLNNYKTYEKWYHIKHNASKLAKEAKYSISEFSKKSIKNFRIIANPGCYPTSIQLALIPLLKKSLIDEKNIFIDSKSGYSGAGKNYKKKFTHKNIDSSIFAYGIEKHRHMSELDQEFQKNSKTKVEYSFQPHLLPTFRGILSSMYVAPKRNISIDKIHKTLKEFHKKNSLQN